MAINSVLIGGSIKASAQSRKNAEVSINTLFLRINWLKPAPLRSKTRAEKSFIHQTIHSLKADVQQTDPRLV